ncbi:MAG: TonB-dependent receptor [Bacteroidetes bacterium]|nr:TonB-dependent receptor [Bacteroidota bacterium]
MKKLLLHIFLFLSATSAFAQEQDTSRVLPETEVHGEKGKWNDVGKSIQTLQPSSLQYDLGTLLQGSSPVFIKSYGPGMLSSLSIRGTGAAHTAILWHGLNIQNGMNGQQDLSLIPGFLFDHAELRTGAQNIPSSGGLLGGRIDLKNLQPTDKFAFHLGTDFGSFGTQRYKVGMDLSEGKWSNRIRAARQHTDNHYSYADESVPGSPQKTLQHAQAEQTSILEEFNYHFNAKTRMGLGIWYNEAQREIPPTMISASTATQEDQSLRVCSFLESVSDKRLFRLSSGLFLDNLWYLDKVKKMDAYNQSSKWVNQLNWEGRGEKINWEVGAGFQSAMALSPDYNPDHVQLNTVSAYGGLHGKYGSRLKWHTDIRQEVRGSVVPLPSASMGGEYQMKHHSNLRVYLTHVSRLPNLNDLYWNPGGNPNLKPEHGFSGELGYHFLKETKKSRIKAHAQAFYSIINNWIIWLPENGYWKPQNLQQVHNRGFEWEASLDKLRKKDFWEFRYGGSFTLASNELAKSSQDESVGKQLIYVPFWKNYLSLRLQWKGLDFLYRQSFTGGRYTSSDNTSYLAPYSLGDFEVNYRFAKDGSRLVFGASIQNIWDVRYQSIQWRPMPGRYFQFSFKIQLVHKKSP